MLRENGEFYPCAASMTTEGELVPLLELEVESEMPDPNQVLVKIAAAFQEEARQGKIRAAACCYNGTAGEESYMSVPETVSRERSTPGEPGQEMDLRIVGFGIRI